MTRTHRPDRMDPMELTVWSGLLSTYATVTRTLDQRLRSEHGMPFRVYDLLATLDMKRDGRLRMSTLADYLVLSPSRLTRVVTDLESRGWLQRGADPDDARATQVTLTREGLAALRGARRTHHGVVRELFLDRLGERDLAALARIWERAGTRDPMLDEALESLKPD